jgi:hypothetical protein
MLIPAVICATLVAATFTSAVFEWRAAMVRVASSLLANNADAVNLRTDKGFHRIAAFHRLCPCLGAGAATKLRSVRLYYGLLEFMSSLGGAVLLRKTSSGSTGWTKGEMALCTRYATAILVRQVERNRLLAAEVRSY